MTNLKLLAQQACKNISSTFNDIKRKTFKHFQNYCNTIKINTVL